MENYTGFYPLTNAQKSIWQIVRFYPNTVFVNLAATIRIYESVQYDLLADAINIVISQNDGIRTRLADDGLEPKQYIAEHSKIQVDYLDFDYPNGKEDFRNWEIERTREPFELFKSNLFDFAIIRMSEEEASFFIKCHHIIADLWSMTLLASEILRCYYSLIGGDKICCEQKPSYIDYILAENENKHSERFEKHRQYWDEAFSTVPEFTTFKGPELSSNVAERKTFSLPPNITSQVDNYCKVNKVSPFSVLFAAFTICIWKLTNKTDIVVSTPVLNRSGVKEKKTMGMFTNYVPFRIKLDTDYDFTVFSKTVAQEWKKVLKHQRYPYELILKGYREYHGTNDKLTDITFSYQNAKFGLDDIDFDAKVIFNKEELNSLAVHIHDRQDIGSYTIDYDYLTEVFSEVDICNLHVYLSNALTKSLSNPGTRLSEFNILSREQEAKLLVEFNRNDNDFPQDDTIVSQFERQCATQPNNTAVIFENKAFTYEYLNIRANQLARLLLAKGVGKDSVVGLIVDRSVEMLIGILAVLKTGGAYLPIDPNYPADRINYMLKDSNTQLLLAYMSDRSTELTFDTPEINLHDQKIYDGSSENLDNSPRPSDLACVIYTSGSTGKPKGVMVEHKGLNNLTYAFSETLSPGNKTVLAISTVSFDMFFVETIFPLIKGWRVILANQQEAMLPYLLLNLIEEYNCNFLQTTPTRMKLILGDNNAHKLESLTDIIIGGESFPKQLFKDLKKTTKAKIYNGYGPTEATICSTIKLLENESAITIGRPLPNTQTYILDEGLKPVPIGASGEIYISGLGVGRGYINNKTLTDERFLPNPFVSGSRMYKTGDTAKWLSNGEIEYIGRNDNQVKIRGFRIELGEIEKRLLLYGSIKEAIVTCREYEGHKKCLCAYITASAQVSIPRLRKYLSSYLPDYMVPAYFVLLDSFPQTPNGKVDKTALPEPASQVVHDSEWVGPRNEIEQRLLEHWTAILKVPKICIDDNIFALGGDSLAILEILSSLFPNNWGLSAQDFYDYPTIRSLSDKISGAMPESVKINTSPVLTLNVKAKQIKVNTHTGNILLTGATGFLGIHILYELLSLNSGKVYCLVRGREPEKRLLQLLGFYFPTLPVSLIQDKVVIVSGDLSQENCGLVESEYLNLAQNISTVIHAAALVKHYGKYDEFYRANVISTRHLIDFCIKHNKKLNYISTTSVSGTNQGNNPADLRFTENDLYIGQNYQSNVYVRSKFEAENHVGLGIEDGLAATVFRVGLLTGRYRDGHFQKNIGENAFYRMLKSLIMLEAVPVEFLQEPLELTPVDFCANAIVRVIQANSPSMPRYHIFNHRTIKAVELIGALQEAGIGMKALPIKSFISLLTSLSKTDQGKEILSGMISEPSLKGAFGSFSSANVDSQLSLQALQEFGFAWPDINKAYLLRLLDYMHMTGFISKSSIVS